MNLTAGLLLLFLNIFLPGLIFLRCYFVGEFSKQFSTRIPVIRLAFYSLIPGLMIQAISIWLYSIHNEKFSLHGAICIYYDLLDSGTNFSNEAKTFLSNIGNYVLYCFWVCLGSAVIGTGLHYLIRKTKLDIRLKILRFRNHWYYVFSGEIRRFDKLKKATKKLNRSQTFEHPDTMMCYADILVSNNGTTKMYTGYIVDYELDSKDTNQLDKIYLIDVEKYNYLEDTEKSFNKKSIPGDLFILDNSQVLNMNLTYIPSPHEISLRENRKKIRSLRAWNALGIIVPITFISLNIQLYGKVLHLECINNFSNHLSIFQKVLISSGLSSISSLALLFNPSEREEDKQKIFKVLIWVAIIMVLVNTISIIYSYY